MIKILKFDNNETEKHKFHNSKHLIDLKYRY